MRMLGTRSTRLPLAVLLAAAAILAGSGGVAAASFACPSSSSSDASFSSVFGSFCRSGVISSTM